MKSLLKRADNTEHVFDPDFSPWKSIFLSKSAYNIEHELEFYAKNEVIPS